MSDKRIAIMGAGSIGTILGALLTRNGVEVDLIDNYAAHVQALNEKGATIVGGLEMTVPVKAYTPDQLTGQYDLVFLLCKQTGTAEALTQLAPHLHENSVVCTLQNGIPEPHVAEIIGRERTMGGIVLFGATWEAPGVSRATSTAVQMEGGTLFEVGEMDGSVTPRLKAVHAFLSNVCKCTLSSNLMGLRWKKVLINSTSSGMSAVLGCEFGTYLDREDAMLVLSCIGNEAAKVAHAEGVDLTEPGATRDFNLCEFTEDRGPREMIPFYHPIWNNTARALKASMLQDLEKGKPCEIDFINGEVVKAGRKHGIPTPYNEALVALVKLAEARKQVWKVDEIMPIFRSMLQLDGIEVNQ